MGPPSGASGWSELGLGHAGDQNCRGKGARSGEKLVSGVWAQSMEALPGAEEGTEASSSSPGQPAVTSCYCWLPLSEHRQPTAVPLLRSLPQHLCIVTPLSARLSAGSRDRTEEIQKNSRISHVQVASTR